MLKFVALSGVVPGVVACAAAGSAVADAARLDLKVWTGDRWGDTLEAQSGQTVRVGLFGVFENAYGFAACVVAIEATGWSSADRFNGGSRALPFDFGLFEQATYVTDGHLRIDAGDDAGNSSARGLNLHQASPLDAAGQNREFSTANPALLYTFEITLASTPGVRAVVFDVPVSQIKLGVLGSYIAADSREVRRDQALTTDIATINVVPAPATLLVLIGAGAARRRRR